MALLIVNFPDEVLANILSQKAASNAVLLMWQCGSRILNKRLSRGGCTSFAASVHELIKWPNLLSRLEGLREVSITADVVSESDLDICRNLLKLPSNLSALELSFDGASRLVFETLNFILLDQSTHPLAYQSLAHRFPLLQRLILRNGDCSKSDLFVAAGQFAFLPRSLTSLSMDHHFPGTLTRDMIPPELTRLSCLGPYYRLISFLPLTLTEVNCPLEFAQLHHFPSLTTLELNSQELRGDSLSMLPRGLQRLSLKARNIPSDAFVSGWPIRLTSLYCNSLSTDQLTLLPSTLLWLTVRALMNYTQRSKSLSVDAVVALWPMNLTSLTFKSPISVSVGQLGTFPPLLTTLKRVEIGLKKTCRSIVFPPRLRHLDFCCKFPSTRRSLVTLPQLLETLTANCIAYAELVRVYPPNFHTLRLDSPINCEYLATLPPTLTSLHLHSLETRRPATLRFLPRSLIDLRIVRLPSLVNDFASLPPPLERLNLPSTTFSCEMFMHLPTTIASLSIRSVTHASPENVRCLPLRWLHFLITSPCVSSDQFLSVHESLPETMRLTPGQTKRFSDESNAERWF